MYAQVLLPIPAPGPFTYSVPPEWVERCLPGVLVLVPVGARQRTGVVWGVGEENPYPGAVKPVAAVLSGQPLLDQRLRHLLEWMSRYYLQPLGSVLATALPGHLEFRCRRRARWLGGGSREEGAVLAEGLPPPLVELAASLLRYRKGLSLEALERRHGKRGLAGHLARLREEGLVALEEEWVPRHRLREGEEEGESPPGDPVVPLAPPPLLNPEQEAALAAITRGLAGGGFTPILLEGVTGSGKTEVYLRAVAECLAGGRQALLLVPEIALTPQLVARYRERFGSDLAVFHSGLGERQRFDHWQAMARGRVHVAVGARSALFAPAERLGLVVVDEEHDSSYKQGEGVPYQARDMAVVRARGAGAVLVLGSATPSLESLVNARQGKYQHLRLSQRATGAPLPRVELVRLGDPLLKEKMAPNSFLTPPLVAAVEGALGRGEQALLFLNRRGYAPTLLCHRCGLALMCPNCSVALTFHKGRTALVCHYCGHLAAVPRVCPQCGQLSLGAFGPGTQRLEQEARERFAPARVARLDRDAVSGPGAADAEAVLAAFARREVEILVGTQMVAKGHHFPALSVVGVVLAETGLWQPDFRAAERTFQMLAQVAGRAGREGMAGRVVIQSLDPEHYAIQAAARHDWGAFAEAELPMRREVGFPPYARLGLLRFSTLSPGEGEGMAARLGSALPTVAGVEFLGPAPAPLFKLRNRYRWQVLAKERRGGALHRGLAALLRVAEPLAGNRVRLEVDVDPYFLS